MEQEKARDCEICKVNKPIESFEFIKNKNAHRRTCKECRNNYKREHRKVVMTKVKNNEIQPPTDITRSCNACNIEKPIKEFPYRCGSNTYEKRCKSCYNMEMQRKKHLKTLDFTATETHKCIECGLVKETSEFKIRSVPTNVYSKKCKTCQKPSNIINDMNNTMLNIENINNLLDEYGKKMKI